MLWVCGLRKCSVHHSNEDLQRSCSLECHLMRIGIRHLAIFVNVFLKNLGSGYIYIYTHMEIYIYIYIYRRIRQYYCHIRPYMAIISMAMNVIKLIDDAGVAMCRCIDLWLYGGMATLGTSSTLGRPKLGSCQVAWNKLGICCFLHLSMNCWHVSVNFTRKS